MGVPLTADMEFRLTDLYTCPVDKPPHWHSTIAGFIVKDHWDLWEQGLIHRIGRGVRLTQLGLESLGVE